MRQKIQDHIKNFVKWVFGNTAWDVLKSITIIVLSSFATWIASFQPSVSKWMTSIDIPVIIVIGVMFVGFFTIIRFIVSTIIQIIMKVFHFPKRHMSQIDAKIEIIPFLEPDKKHLSLEIINKESIDLQDCYITLAHVSYWSNKKGSKEENLTEKLASNNPFLSWREEANNERKNIAKNGGKGIVTVAILTDYSKGFCFSFYRDARKNLTRQGQYHVGIKVNARKNGDEVGHSYSGVFLFQYQKFDQEENNPGASLVNYQLEAGRTMAISENGQTDLIITQFGWMQGE